MKVSELKSIVDTADIEGLKAFIEEYKNDERSSVIKQVERANKKITEYIAEVERTEKMKRFEKENADCQYIAGLDEVGRGPLCGPVVTCAVILPKDCNILYINDSKQVSKKKREELYDIITKEAIDYKIGIKSPEYIDEVNILNATKAAMKDSIEGLKVKPDLLLIDSVKLNNVDIKQISMDKGDTLSISIAAASIVAKVTRDRMMEEYAKQYPEYGFDRNSGYGTKEHIEALKKYGPTPIHRKTFIKNFIEE